MVSKEELAEKLMEIPAKITGIQESILNLSEVQLSLQRELNEITASIKSEINSTIDTNGKKIYTNAESRDSAFVEISAGNPDYLSKEEELNKTDTSIKSLKIQLEEENNIQRNLRAVLPLFYQDPK